jgi:hypothetical protein
MASLPGIIGLLLFLYVRPHELVPQLRDYNFLYIFLAISVVGILYDVSRGNTQLMMTPMLPWALLFCVWCVFTLLVHRPDLVVEKSTGIVVCLIIYLVMAYGLQQARSYLAVVTTIFVFGLFVACVGVDEGFTPFQCFIANPIEDNGPSWPDGRECSWVEPGGARHDGIYDCTVTGDPELVYRCEHPGFFGASSIAGRVRYLGILNDPNDLALAISLAVPFAFMFFELRRTALRVVLLAFTLALVALAIVFTQSRGGQLTFGVVIGSYFVKRYGWKRGLVVGALMAVPVLILGGRPDDPNAQASTLERLACAAAGIKMLRGSPITGVGYTLYTEHHGQTAHNAYVLPAGETGSIGMWLFGFVVYLAVKVPLAIVNLRLPDEAETKLTQAAAMAMVASLIGAAVGIAFLSWTYHYVLWIHFGLSAALFTVVKRRLPTFRVPFTWKEKLVIMGGYIGYLVVWSYYIKWKGAWD